MATGRGIFCTLRQKRLRIVELIVYTPVCRPAIADSVTVTTWWLVINLRTKRRLPEQVLPINQALWRSQIEIKAPNMSSWEQALLEPRKYTT